MKILAIIILMNLPFISLSQSEINKDNWFQACDSFITQADLNFCTYNVYKKADSLMAENYNVLLRHIDQAISFEYEKSQHDLEHHDWLTSLKETIVVSQEKWLELRIANSAILNIQYKGGSMRSMAMNISATNDTFNRIKYLNELIEITIK